MPDIESYPGTSPMPVEEANRGVTTTPPQPSLARRSVLRGSLAVAAMVALSAVRAAPVAADPGGRDPAPDGRVARLETDFLSGMVPHHRGAVMMAEMAVMKSQRRQLRELAEKIIEAQTREIGEMSHVLRDWYGLDAPAGHMMPPEIMARMMMPVLEGLMPDMEARMRALQAKSGADFDIEFMSAMTDHHAMAVMMAAPVLISGHHAGLYEMAVRTVIDQGEEIQQFQQWLNEWYSVPRALLAP